MSTAETPPTELHLAYDDGGWAWSCDCGLHAGSRRWPDSVGAVDDGAEHASVFHPAGWRWPSVLEAAAWTAGAFEVVDVGLPPGTETYTIRLGMTSGGHVHADVDGSWWECSCGQRAATAGAGVAADPREEAIEHVRREHRRPGSPPPHMVFVEQPDNDDGVPTVTLAGSVEDAREAVGMTGASPATPPRAASADPHAAHEAEGIPRSWTADGLCAACLMVSRYHDACMERDIASAEADRLHEHLETLNSWAWDTAVALGYVTDDEIKAGRAEDVDIDRVKGLLLSTIRQQRAVKETADLAFRCLGDHADNVIRDLSSALAKLARTETDAASLLVAGDGLAAVAERALAGEATDWTVNAAKEALARWSEVTP